MNNRIKSLLSIICAIELMKIEKIDQYKIHLFKNTLLIVFNSIEFHNKIYQYYDSICLLLSNLPIHKWPNFSRVKLVDIEKLILALIKLDDKTLSVLRIFFSWTLFMLIVEILCNVLLMRIRYWLLKIMDFSWFFS